MKIRHFSAEMAQKSDAVVFFAGWGSSPERFADLLPKHRDLWLVWDYGDLSTELTALQALRNYDRIDVVGWSLGVRVAADRIPTLPVRISRFCAVAGTLTPIDRRLGIVPIVFDRTTDSWNAEIRDAFLTNMTGSEDIARRLGFGDRTLSSLGGELQSLRAAYRERPFTGELSALADEIVAFVPQSDRIVPTLAQERAWHALNVAIHTTPEAHWCPKALLAALAGEPTTNLCKTLNVDPKV